VHREGKIGSTRHELNAWVGTLAQPWMIAMEATIFTGWIYLQLLPDSDQPVRALPGAPGDLAFSLDDSTTWMSTIRPKRGGRALIQAVPLGKVSQSHNPSPLP